MLCVIDIYGKNAWVVPLKKNKALQLLILSKIFWMNQVTNQAKYG